MPRKYDVTKMIESTTIYFKEFSLEKGMVVDTSEEIKDFDDTMPDDKVILMLRNKYKHANAVQITGKKKVSAYYGMTKETFMKHAAVTNNKDGRNLIKRTMNAYNVEYLYFDFLAKETQSKHGNVFIDKVDEYELHTLKGLNMVRKLRETVDKPIMAIINHEKVSEMYGMSVSDFIKYADVISSDEMSENDETSE